MQNNPLELETLNMILQIYFSIFFGRHVYSWLACSNDFVHVFVTIRILRILRNLPRLISRIIFGEHQKRRKYDILILLRLTMQIRCDIRTYTKSKVYARTEKQKMITLNDNINDNTHAVHGKVITQK